MAPWRHSGVSRTLSQIKRYYYWNNMNQNVAKCVKMCQKCQTAKNNKKYHWNWQIHQANHLIRYLYIMETNMPLTIISCNGAKSKCKVSCESNIGIFYSYLWSKEDVHFGHGTEYKNTILTELCNLLRIKIYYINCLPSSDVRDCRNKSQNFEYVIWYTSVDETDRDEWLKYVTPLQHPTIFSS